MGKNDMTRYHCVLSPGSVYPIVVQGGFPFR